MGFFKTSVQSTSHLTSGLSVKFLHKAQCAACSLNKTEGFGMKPYGAKKPLIYMLGEAPGKQDIKRGRHFSGIDGKVLRMRIPDDSVLRWNYCVRSFPAKDGEYRQPSNLELECCKPSVITDIEKSKPKALFGFGNVVLYWALHQSNVSKWCGRMVPVKIGNHSCWFFPMMDPAFVAKTRKFKPRSARDYGSEQEFAFSKQLRDAVALVEFLPDPVVHDRDMAMENIDFVTGGKGEVDLEKVVTFIKGLYHKKVVGLDLETTCLRPYGDGAKILTVALASNNKSMSFPLEHPGSQFTDGQKKRLFKVFGDFLRKAKCRKAVHNLSFEMEWLAYFFGKDILRRGRWSCTQSQAYILDERQGALSLQFLCMQYFGLDIKALNPVNRKDLINTPVDEVLRYNAVDAKYHRLLHLVQRSRLVADKLTKVYREQYRRIPTFVLSQLAGIPINQRRVQKFYDLYSKRLEVIESEIKSHAVYKRFKSLKGSDFRIASNPDNHFLIEKVLKMDIDVNKKGKKSVDSSMLEKLDHPFLDLVLRWRKTNKLLSTYVLPVKEGSDLLYDGLIHPVIKVTATDTWRTSSEDPNIQNWPSRQNRQIRRQVKGRRGTVIVSFDFAGIQARNVAMESLDEALVAAFCHRYDIHSDWMERIYKRYPKWIGSKLSNLDASDKKSFRHAAKNKFVFPSFFGSQPKSIASDLQVPLNIAETLHEEFWDEFPDIKKWHERIHKDYRKYGYVTGLSGFRRRAPISPTQLINAPIQSDEAVIVMDSMCRLSELDDPRFQPILEVHDDLTFLWDASEVDTNAEVVISAMLDTSYDWAKVVPLGVEMSLGKNWADQEAVGEFFSDTWNGSM